MATCVAAKQSKSRARATPGASQVDIHLRKRLPSGNSMAQRSARSKSQHVKGAVANAPGRQREVDVIDSNQEGGEASTRGAGDAVGIHLSQAGPFSGSAVGCRPGTRYGDADEVNIIDEVANLLAQFLVSGNEVSQSALHDFMVQAGHPQWKSWANFVAALQRQPRPFFTCLALHQRLPWRRCS